MNHNKFVGNVLPSSIPRSSNQISERWSNTDLRYHTGRMTRNNSEGYFARMMVPVGNFSIKIKRIIIGVEVKVIETEVVETGA